MDHQDVDAAGHEAPESPTGAENSSIRRACDACRARKIRCDRTSPCAQCLQSKIDCTYAATRPKEKRSRILLTTQYEKKIDLIDRRLQGVTQLLEELRLNWSSTPAQQSKDSSVAPQTISSTGSTPYGHVLPSSSDSPLVEGESSLIAHSVFANEFLQEAVRTGSLQDSSLEMRQTLDSLHHIVESLSQQTGATEMTYPKARPVPRRSLPSIELPPIQKAVALFRAVKTEPYENAGWFCDYISMQRFPDLCLRVYFSDDYSDAEFILVQASLHFLFWEVAARAKGEEKDDCVKWADVCQGNLETALANLPLHLPATSDMIIALIFGAFHAIELSKPTLSWTLVSKASELCQHLGYHRISSMKNNKDEEIEHKLLLFWSVYYLDKSLSLRLGRSSSIQDWDINVPDLITHAPDGPMGYHFYHLWSRTARVQGQIYEHLYSPECMTQPDHVRTFRVDALVKELKEITVHAADVEARFNLHRGKDKAAPPNLMLAFFSISDKVLRLSLLTLVYRASPRTPGSPTTFSVECVDTARAALQEHQNCMVFLDKLSSIFFPSYVHWTVLFAPFTPFIVLFCQVIETRDQTDLARLHAFLTSIQKAPTVSDAAAKMFRLFQVLYSVALRYVEFQISAPQKEQVQASAELDNYLAALGFPSAAAAGFEGQQQAQATEFANGGIDAMGMNNPMMWMGPNAQLDDWFSSNQQMMGLVQESNFDFPPDTDIQ